MIFCILLQFYIVAAETFGVDSNLENHRPVKIAIIGGGIGGTAAAYELTQKANEMKFEFEIDLFEPNDIGGRLATVEVNNHFFEIGGSIIHRRNRYMAQYCKQFKLNMKSEDTKERVFGFFDGEKLVLQESSYYFITLLKLFWRYGRKLANLDNDYVARKMDSFDTIYQKQKNMRTFDSVKSLLGSMSPGFRYLLKKSLRDDLANKGFHGLLVEEFAFLQINVNYNQNLDLHAFVGTVGLAGGSDNLYYVEGGNKKVAEALLSNSDANLIKKKVEAISLSPDGGYGIQIENEEYTRKYDLVILAAPLLENSPNRIKFENFEPSMNSTTFKYQKTIATVVHGELNHTYFGSSSKAGLNSVFATREGIFFNSVSLIYPVTVEADYDYKVFKIFSKDILTEDQLNLLFVKRDTTIVKEWFAYPHYDLSGRNPIFKLHNNLFHINAIEWAASAMEMSLLGAHNVVNLVIQTIKSDDRFQTAIYV